MSPNILTFLFTDLEGSTRLWEEYPENMQAVMARHDELLRRIVEENSGHVVKTTGDGMHVAFISPGEAVQAALACQLALKNEPWPTEIGMIRVRMGLHTGESQERDGDYYGSSLNRAARIMAAGSGGQVLLSSVTADLVSNHLPGETSLRDLGEHSLRDLTQPDRIYQLCHPELQPEFPELKSLAKYRHNLPLQLTSFIGREQDIERVKQLLSQTRLLTLLGPGGTGKTRLMLQVAADLLEEFPDGVWLIELAPLSDPELIVDQAASVFGVSQQPGRNLIDSLVEHLRRKTILLLLDNVEHLVADSAKFAEQLLRACPNLKILVTGRESLFIGGESTLQIPSLKLPEAAGSSAYDDAIRSEAVHLFMERVRSVRPDFVMDPHTAPAVIEIVRRLDGIPLALELAAARVRAMSVQQIADRLNDRFSLLTGGRRTAMPRQQTLQALIEWSWNLLDEEEKTLLGRLSVFSGGWKLEAAEQVTGFDGLDVLDGIDQLVSKSLVIADSNSDGSIRYRMLESIHQYAQDRLLESGEARDLRDRHLEFVIDLVRQVQPKLRGSGMLLWQERMFNEMDNFRSARDWSLEVGPEKALELAGVFDLTTRFWLPFSETKRWLDEVEIIGRPFVERTSDPGIERDFANMLIILGSTVFILGDNVRSSALLKEGIARTRKLGALQEMVYGLSMAMLVEVFSGNRQSARLLSEEAIEISRRENFDMELIMALGSITPAVIFGGDISYAIAASEESVRLAHRSKNPWMEAMAEQQQSRIAQALGDWDKAIAHFARAVEMFRAVRDKGFEIVCMSDMGHLLRRQGDFEAAEKIYFRTIDYFYEVGSLIAVAHQLESFGYAAIARGDLRRAAILLGAGAHLREMNHSVMTIPVEVADYKGALETLEDSMGKEALEEARAAGRQMTIEEAVDFAKDGVSSSNNSLDESY